MTPAAEPVNAAGLSQSEYIGIAILPGKHIITTMLNTEDRQMIRDLAEKYALKRVLLFGSASRMDTGYRDIDLAVEGGRPQDFFSLYGELMSRLSLPVDLIDLSRPSRFTRLVREEGVPIYG